jgi:hypothetical protein
MGDEYGWTANGRQIFDPERLNKAAADLKAQNTGTELMQKLEQGLLDPAAFGSIGGGPEAAARLREAYHAMITQLKNVGVDLEDLATRTLAAADAAWQVDPVTQAAARRAARMTE